MAWTQRGNSLARRTNKTIGTGITKRELVQFDTDTPSDVGELIRAIAWANMYSSFDLLSKKITDDATNILIQAGMPTDRTINYYISEAKKWVPLKPGRRRKSRAHVHFSHLELVLQIGHEADSAVGFAARLLEHIDEARRLKAEGQFDEAMAMAFAIGGLLKEASMKEVWEPEALLGLKVKMGGRAGHEAKYGTDEEKALLQSAYVETFDQNIAKGLRRMAAYDATRKRHKVSLRTIQRAVKLSRR